MVSPLFLFSLKVQSGNAGMLLDIGGGLAWKCGPRALVSVRGFDRVSVFDV